MHACLRESLKRLRKCHNDPRYKVLAKNYKESENVLIALENEMDAGEELKISEMRLKKTEQYWRNIAAH